MPAVPKPRKYRLPDFLSSTLKQASYEKWLHGRAIAHVKRDRKRGNKTANTTAYKEAIHRAVADCGGRDHYTGERLNWSLLGRYDNAKSKAKGRHYKATLALLPSVDHVGDGLGEADFKICAWRTNDAKNDLTLEEFIDLCRRVVAHFDKERQMMSQRDKMRSLIERFGDDEKKVCKEYAEAERNREVERKRKNNTSPEEFARLLYRDAHRQDAKRWPSK